MSAPDYIFDEEPGESVQFDRLCELCTKLFDSEAAWETDLSLASIYDRDYRDRDYRSHHDIRALEKSADAGCHPCNLIFGQIDSSDLGRMRKDLDEAFVPSYRQIGILIQSFQNSYTLQVNAWKRCISSQSDGLGDLDQTSSTDQQSWSTIAKLDVNHEEQDYANEERSTSHLNYSDATLLQIAHWTRECLTSHTECFDIQTVTATRDILPLRLLDLAPALHADFIRLESSKPLPLHTVYVTLSHCWGGHCKTTLTTSSLATFRAGIQLSTLPKTFQDAVLLTRNLSIRYLWIDALCIIQDSNQEWSHEASLMGDIYANSSLTISATNSPDSEGGLYHSRSALSVWPCRITATWDCFPVDKLVLNIPGWVGERAMEPLSNRGWAFQEWLLSKRIIHFSRDQVRWQCHCLAASEVYPRGLEDYDLEDHGIPTKNIIRLLKDEDASPRHLWEWIRQEYSEKHLTVATDKLAAFSGIARMIHKVFKSPKEDYIAGLWRPELLTELLWEKYSEGYIKVTQRTHSSQYIAPSWSWASIDGPFWDFKGSYYKSDHLGVYARILEAKTFPRSDDYGPVDGGFLTIRGSLCYVELTSSPRASLNHSSREWKASFTQGLSLTHKWSDAKLDNVSHTRSSPSTKDSFYFMPMLSRNTGSERFDGALIGLLLKNTANGVHQYRRSGLLELFGLDKEGLLSSSSGLVPLDSDHSKNVDTSDIYTIEIV
ncbi:hypothetical protein MMC28_004767 [Mycoblastus sanguinarius]|nr:hypothetical protein [Mycoblastus sanguinarius]